jgi:hypothetical protein
VVVVMGGGVRLKTPHYKLRFKKKEKKEKE